MLDKAHFIRCLELLSVQDPGADHVDEEEELDKNYSDCKTIAQDLAPNILLSIGHL